MDATTEPRSGDKTRPHARRRPPQHPVGRSRAFAAGNHRRCRRRGDAHRSIANRTGLNISTCHHLLATLIQRGFAAKVSGRRLYTLGTRILDLGHACLQVDLPRRAEPYLEAVNRSTGETVHLAGLQGDSVVTLAVREARHAVRVDTGMVGRLAAPHATSIGKAMLAWLPEDEIRRILGHGMKRFTDHTITELPAFLEALRAVRRDGYASTAKSTCRA